jgi:ADP-L-glycero-D-manno-heptose 6-epimerase
MILVTGGAGFIGSNIVAALAEKGEEVAVCDRFGADDKWRNLAKHELAEIIAPEQVIDWLNGHVTRVTAVLHMGAISSTTETDVDLIVENNVRFSQALWTWCAQHGNPFIYASSAATYGDGSAGFDDEWSPEALARLRPLNAYGWSKHMFDRRVARLITQRMPSPPHWAGLKFFNVYGPNEYHKGNMKSVLAQNFAAIQAGQPIRLFRSYRDDYADGGQLRDFVAVEDCVAVVLWLLISRMRRAGTSLGVTLLSAAVFYWLCVTNIMVTARPDALGLMLFVAAVIIPWERDFRRGPAILGLACAFLAFHCKAYFALAGVTVLLGHALFALSLLLLGAAPVGSDMPEAPVSDAERRA